MSAKYAKASATVIAIVMSGTSAMKFNPIMKILMTVEYRFGRSSDGFSKASFSFSCVARAPFGLFGSKPLNLRLRVVEQRKAEEEG